MTDEKMPLPPAIDFDAIIARRREKAIQEDLDRPAALERAAAVNARIKERITKEVEAEITKVVARAASIE